MRLSSGSGVLNAIGPACAQHCVHIAAQEDEARLLGGLDRPLQAGMDRGKKGRAA
jgi:hypothetical protein